MRVWQAEASQVAAGDGDDGKQALEVGFIEPPAGFARFEVEAEGDAEVAGVERVAILG